MGTLASVHHIRSTISDGLTWPVAGKSIRPLVSMAAGYAPSRVRAAAMQDLRDRINHHALILWLRPHPLLLQQLQLQFTNAPKTQQPVLQLPQQLWRSSPEASTNRRGETASTTCLQLPMRPLLWRAPSSRTHRLLREHRPPPPPSAQRRRLACSTLPLAVALTQMNMRLRVPEQQRAKNSILPSSGSLGTNGWRSLLSDLSAYPFVCDVEIGSCCCTRRLVPCSHEIPEPRMPAAIDDLDVPIQCSHKLGPLPEAALVLNVERLQRSCDQRRQESQRQDDEAEDPRPHLASESSSAPSRLSSNLKLETFRVEHFAGTLRWYTSDHFVRKCSELCPNCSNLVPLRNRPVPTLLRTTSGTLRNTSSDTLVPRESSLAGDQVQRLLIVEPRRTRLHERRTRPVRGTTDFVRSHHARGRENI